MFEARFGGAHVTELVAAARGAAVRSLTAVDNDIEKLVCCGSRTGRGPVVRQWGEGEVNLGNRI
jgi:hypothetical protein